MSVHVHVSPYASSLLSNLAPHTIKSCMKNCMLYVAPKKGLTADNLQLLGEDQSLDSSLILAWASAGPVGCGKLHKSSVCTGQSEKFVFLTQNLVSNS